MKGFSGVRVRGVLVWVGLSYPDPGLREWQGFYSEKNP